MGSILGCAAASLRSMHLIISRENRPAQLCSADDRDDSTESYSITPSSRTGWLKPTYFPGTVELVSLAAQVVYLDGCLTAPSVYTYTPIARGWPKTTGNLHAEGTVDMTRLVQTTYRTRSHDPLYPYMIQDSKEAYRDHITGPASSTGILKVSARRRQGPPSIHYCAYQ